MASRYPRFLSDDLPDLGVASRFHIIPVPYEKTVSYGRGTAKGPRALLAASRQLEAFDGVGVPGAAGIHTTSAIEGGQLEPEAMVQAVHAAAAAVLTAGSIPIVLGGEHTVSLGAVRATCDHYPGIGVVQFDAHADLRDSYEGTPYSHACVMRRLSEEHIPLYQIGVRSLSATEERFRREGGIPHLDAAQIAAAGVPDSILPPDFPRDLYITFDIDALDPAIMPATGTPEPGGLSWYQALAALKAVTCGRTVRAFDLVELAPISGFSAPTFTAAKLLYRMIATAT